MNSVASQTPRADGAKRRRRQDSLAVSRERYTAPVTGEQVRWDAVVFTPDDGFVIDTYRLTPFDDATIGIALAELGLSVETVEGFDEADRRTVFVARDQS